MCGVPESGTNTEEPKKNLLYRDKHTYECLLGYETDDALVTECQSNGSFSLDQPPECRRKR